MIRNRQAPPVGRWSAVLLLAAVLSLAACADLEHQYIRQDKLYRIALIEDTRSFDTLLVSSEYLGDPDPEIRARAALAIGRIGKDWFTARFREQLADSSEQAAAAKFFAAGLLGDSSLFQPVYDLALNGSPAADVAVEALGRLGDSTRGEQLAGFLDSPDTAIAYQAMLAMFRARAWDAADRVAALGMNTGNRTLRYGALYSLARSGRPEGRDLFLASLSDPEFAYRLLAYNGLGRIADTASIEQIASGLNDGDERVVASAIRALQAFDDLGAMYIGRKLPDWTDEKLVVMGVETLGQFSGVSDAGEIVERRLRTDSRENVRAAAAEALLQIRGQDGLYVIDEVLTAPTIHEKVCIASGLAELDKAAAVARLGQLFNDASPLVRVTALDGLCTVDSNGAMKYLEKALGDADDVVRAIAVDIAARQDRRLLIPTIAGLYIEHRDEIGDDLKRSILDAWTVFASDSGASDSLMITVLEEGCNDEWLFIRETAAGILFEKFAIDRRPLIGSGRSSIEKINYRDKFDKYATNPRAEVTTALGVVEIELLYRDAPMTVNNYIALAESGYFDGLHFHRVVPAFVVQDGCPLGTGWGGPGWAIRSEFDRVTYATGVVGMAHSGKDTGGSQWFIALAPQPHLDGRYTAFGRVISGMDIVRRLVRGDRIDSIRIIYQGE